MNEPTMTEGTSSERSAVAARWGRALARLQETSGKTQREVAAGLGYSETNYGRILNGQVGPPSLERVLQALEYYGVRPELFWTLIEAPAVEPRPGVDPEIERRLALAEELGNQILEIARQGRQRGQGPSEQPESPHGD